MFRTEIRDSLCETAEIVVRSKFAGDTQLDPVARGQIASLLSFLIRHIDMRAGGLRNRVDRLFCMCLRQPAMFGHDTPAYDTVQRAEYVGRFVELVDFQILDVDGDRDAIRGFLEWVDTWQAERKAQLRSKIGFLRQWHPETDMWDIVRFV